VFCLRSLANKSEAKRVDDWRCPSGSTSPAGSRRRDGSADLKARAIDPAAGLQPPAADRARPATTAWPRSDAARDGDSGSGSVDSAEPAADGTPQVHIILLVFAGLFLAMLAVGVLSYYRALRGS